MPEALIASMLNPEEFGNYYAVGSEHTTQGQAAFFEVDIAFRRAGLPIAKALARCVPHEDGRPKHTVYASVYRVLERIPLSAIGSLYLTTKDGRTLEVTRSKSKTESGDELHLYHEVAPVRPLVVSRFGPEAFFHLLCGGSETPLSIPAIAFAELRLGELAADPARGSLGDLPYDNISHLRSCLEQVKSKEVAAKVVDRLHPGAFSYRTIKDGVYLGNKAEGLALYRLPPWADLKETNYQWWKSATI